MGHFFESLGLSGPPLAGEHLADTTETVGEEGVVLSSMPEDFGFPPSDGGLERSLCLSDLLPQRETQEELHETSVSLRESTHPGRGESNGGSTVPEFIASVNSEETLNLRCPVCSGSLLLHRRDLGVEGACVWCHTPIVACEDTRVGQIDIFPFSGHEPSSSAPNATRPGIRLIDPSIKTKSLSVGDQASTMRTPPPTKVEPFPARLEANDCPLAPTDAAAGSPPDSAPTGLASAIGISIGTNSNPVTNTAADEAPALLQPLTSTAGPVAAPAFFGTDAGISHRLAEPRQGGTTTTHHDLGADRFAQKGPDHPDSAAPSPCAPKSAPETGGNATRAVSSATPKKNSRARAGKRKLRPRKGFVILMVVIVGFTSGAALASFILPVDDYVSAARSYMESRFRTGAAPRLPGMPEGSGRLLHDSAASDPLRP